MRTQFRRKELKCNVMLAPGISHKQRKIHLLGLVLFLRQMSKL